MTGGDRMFDHGYASLYALYLSPLLGCESLTLVEVGILQGTGLAIWCDLFPTAEVIGLDIDLDHYRGNLERLRHLGAFRENRPTVFEFDQLGAGSSRRAREILNGKRVHIVIDDGLHTLDAIANTFVSLRPFLADRFVYFVEDFPGLLDKAPDVFDRFEVHEHGAFTVVLPGTTAA